MCRLSRVPAAKNDERNLVCLKADNGVPPTCNCQYRSCEVKETPESRKARKSTTKAVLHNTWRRYILRLLLLPSLLFGQASHPNFFSRAKLTPHLSSIPMPPARGSYTNEFIRKGHSHNDYFQRDPLSSALTHGIYSVEVDVFPRRGELLVAHTMFELTEGRTIKNLYIDPLLRILSHPGPVASPKHDALSFPGRPRRSHRLDDTLTLLVDFKADARKSVDLLHQAIAPLHPYLSRVDKRGKLHKGKVQILLSGNRPDDVSLISDTGDRFLFLDGRSGDVHANTDTKLVPMVSLPYRNLKMARLMGRGDRYLQRMATKAHSQGKLLRVWGTPNKEYLWAQLLKNNVDLLSIDDHPKFVRFATRAGSVFAGRA